jgi:hypothetical protein
MTPTRQAMHALWRAWNEFRGEMDSKGHSDNAIDA